MMQRYVTTLLEFQSTHPYRVWRITENEDPTRTEFQSTHPYRVWHSDEKKFKDSQEFQSTHPYRVWLSVLIVLRCDLMFQSTHPYRVWRDETWPFQGKDCFNPHTHTGCDRSFPQLSFSPDMFQSTHPYRVWRLGMLLPCFVRVSIHTPIQGVTTTGLKYDNYLKFQSTHPYRVWRYSDHFW